VRFEVLTAASMKMTVLWVVAPYDRPDGEGRKPLWNVGKLLPDCTVQQSRRQPSSSNMFHSACKITVGRNVREYPLHRSVRALRWRAAFLIPFDGSISHTTRPSVGLFQPIFSVHPLREPRSLSEGPPRKQMSETENISTRAKKRSHQVSYSLQAISYV
jgi:hypothetical protein